jgi:putative aldouronate transport system permease protein
MLARKLKNLKNNMGVYNLFSLSEKINDKIFISLCYIILITVVLIIAIPLWYVIIASISSPVAVSSGEVYFLPKGISFVSYRRVFQDKELIIGYKNTAYYTFVGTIINIVLTLTCAYGLSKKEMWGRNILMFFFTFTMFFSGGLIPSYIVVKKLNMLNTMWSLIVPGAVSIYNVIIARTFFQNPVFSEIEESAKLDGCSILKTFVFITLPLSKAIISVLTLFYAVNHWNAYFSALIYLTDRAKFPLQLFLREILIENQMKDSMMEFKGSISDLLDEQYNISEQIKFSIIIISSGPVFIIYPFIQKYFVKGIMIGSLKG